MWIGFCNSVTVAQIPFIKRCKRSQLCPCWKEPYICGKCSMNDYFMLKIISVCYLKLTGHNELLNTKHATLKCTCDMYTFLKHGNEIQLMGLSIKYD